MDLGTPFGAFLDPVADKVIVATWTLDAYGLKQFISICSFFLFWV